MNQPVPKQPLRLLLQIELQFAGISVVLCMTNNKPEPPLLANDVIYFELRRQITEEICSSVNHVHVKKN